MKNTEAESAGQASAKEELPNAEEGKKHRLDFETLRQEDYEHSMKQECVGGQETLDRLVLDNVAQFLAKYRAVLLLTCNLYLPAVLAPPIFPYVSEVENALGSCLSFAQRCISVE